MITKSDGTIILTVRVTLKPGRDDDLIALVQSAPLRGMAATVRESMRSGVALGAESEDDDFELPDLGEDL
jgi:hypothetical protein